MLVKSGESTFTGHSKVIQAVGWSCDGKRLATASGDTSARVWTVDAHREGRELELKDHTQTVEGVSWHPKQPDTLATISQDKTLRIWDIRTKKCVPITTPDEILNVMYSPDGNYIAISDKAEAVRLIDVRKNKVVFNYSLPNSVWVNELSWLRDGSGLLLAAGRQANVEKGLVELVRVDVDVPEIRAVHSIVSAVANCMCVAIDPQNKYFAAGSYDGMASIWDLADLVSVRPCCTTLEDPIGALAFSFDGSFIAGVSDIDPRNTTSRKLVDVCEVATGESCIKLEAKAIPKKIAWHPNQLILAYGGEKLVDEYRDNRNNPRVDVPVTVVTFQQK